MARRRSRRKMPDRSDYMLKEQKKVEATLDPRTMQQLSKFFNKGVISKLEHIIAVGKESDVYMATAGDAEVVRGEYVIVKFFRIETSTFFNMADYITGDPRFTKMEGRSKAAVIDTWCRKEFGNLEIAERAGVLAPKPYMFNKSILAMEFIGHEGAPAPQLRNYRMDIEEAEKIRATMMGYVKKMYLAGLVHGDLSEYNTLIKDGKPYLIDFGQAVVTRHPHAPVFLKRDIDNVAQYFRHTYGIETDAIKEYKDIVETADRDIG
ncbi:RIO-like kinase [mine drainage metagenome]|uniref:non-specific serine/threonine protein kinase n=1 Tax=mine drainage metagenome TaxID=410659 RepID=T0YC74_9ZZZZ